MFRNPARKMKAADERGFTLVEIMVVISIILILLAMAMPIYSRSLKRAREDALRKNLETLNESIDQYTLDKQKAPKSLSDLVSAGYVKQIPADITDRTDTWVVDEDDSIRSIYQKEGGITAVHSGSSQTAIDGTAYSTW
jgi:general secretion pathway protein G